MRTPKSLLEWPVAVFPGADNHSAIVIYELDTTIAVFTVDFDRRDENGLPPPPPLKDTVLFSNFAVRACTKAEVDYLRQYIASSPDSLSRNAFALFGPKVEPARFRQGLLNALELGTIPHEERSGDRRYQAKPQILPEK